MKALSVSLVALLVAAMLALTLANSAVPTAASISRDSLAQAADQAPVAVQLTALQLPEGVRYSVTVINSSDLALPQLSAILTLPPDANLVQAFDSDGYTHFDGAVPSAQGIDLFWTGNFKAGDYVDALSFILSGPVSANIGVNLKWGGAQPGQIAFWGQPTVLAAGDTDDKLSIGAAGTGDALFPVGATGVLIGVPAGQLADGTTLHVHLMDPSENPPDTGDLWWCSAVQVDGLPAGAEISVLVPLRAPLAPGAPVSLFSRQADGKWGQLNATGIVTFDGQHVAYAHRGGAIATGIQNTFQPKPKIGIKTGSSQPTAVPTSRPISTAANQPTKIPPTKAPPTVVRAVATLPRIIPTVVIIRGTPTKIPNPPTLIPTLPIIRVTKVIPTLVLATHPPATATTVPPTQPPSRVTIAPSLLTAKARSTQPPSATATIGVKSVVPTPTPTTSSANPCTAQPGVLCFGSGGASLISLCTQAGVNCISTNPNGSVCFTVNSGGTPQCTAPGATVILTPGVGIRIIGQLLATNTPVVKRTAFPTINVPHVITLAPTAKVIIVTATFVPQPTICVQDTQGGIDCTNQNGQLVPQPTATPRNEVCFVDLTSGDALFGGTDTLTICVQPNGVECFTGTGLLALFDGTCLAPGEPGYIPPP